MSSILKVLEFEMEKIEYKNTIPIEQGKLDIIFEALKKIDIEMKPLLDILHCTINAHIDSKFKTMILKRILSFYGFGSNINTLDIRHVTMIEDGIPFKTPLINGVKKEIINILLKESNLNV